MKSDQEIQSEGGQEEPADQLSNLRQITLTGLLLALYLAVDTLPSPIPPPFSGFLKFTAFPSILAGLLIGPSRGALVGALGDVLHYALHPRGPYLPLFTLTGALTGYLPAALLRGRPRSLLNLALAIGFSQALTKLGMVPFLLDHYFGRPWQITLPVSICEQAMHVPLYAYMCLSISRHWQNYLRHRVV